MTVHKRLYEYWITVGYKLTIVLTGLVVVTSFLSGANAFFMTLQTEHQYRHLRRILAQDRLLAKDGKTVVARLRGIRTQRRALLRPFCATTMHQLLANTILSDPHLLTNISNIASGNGTLTPSPSASAAPLSSPAPSVGELSSPALSAFRVRLVSETTTGGYYLVFRTLARLLAREPTLSAQVSALAPGTAADREHDDLLTATVTIRQWRLPRIYCRTVLRGVRS